MPLIRLFKTCLTLSLCMLMVVACQKRKPVVLVFTKTSGWKHTSIPFGIEAIQKLGMANNFDVDTSRDATIFNDDDLKKYSAVVFLSTTGNILNGKQQTAFERYIQAGGGFVGIHSAAATEYEWSWYAKLMGAHFSSHPHHPGVRAGEVVIVDSVHESTRGLPKVWRRDEEWYSYKSFYPGLNVVAMLDENSYVGGTNGSYHPIAWYHEFDGGKAFYTGLGHEDKCYNDSEFVQHILGGIRYAMDHGPLNYAKSYATEVPDENRFTKTILAADLDSPMELAVNGNGDVYFTELRSGKFQCYQSRNNATILVHQFPVNTAGGTGLIGVTLDPKFKQNNFLYVYYAPPTQTEPIVFRLSRFTLTANQKLDLQSEKILLEVPVQKNSGAHHGGSLAWDASGNLYLSTGDSSSPFPSNGYAPLDQRAGDEFFSLDAQRGPANSNDFKGKVLRIHPEIDGSYTIPEGNLFPKGMGKTKPEIYVMGCRNPYRIAVNKKTSTLYWGDIGPDAGKDSVQGPMGYDEFNQATKAGNFGWPYFIGNNRAYRKWDFATNTAGAAFDVENPVNNSPNNTGIRSLPQPVPAMIWYPYRASKEFPEFGTGGRSAMAGDVYHYDENATGKKFPPYFDGSLFVFDWMRNWVMALRFDDEEVYQRSEPFLYTSGDFRRPIDLAFGSDGVMYMLEYGSVYGVDNEDARLVKIEYNDGNRPPNALAVIEDSAAYAALDQRVFLTSELKTLPRKKSIVGTAPLRVRFNGRNSVDPDDDNLQYEWLSNGKTISQEANPIHTFYDAGNHKVVLKTTDTNNLSGYDTVVVDIGNDAPVLTIASPDNTSFYWPAKPFRYTINVTDADGKVDKRNVQVVLKSHVPKVALPMGFSLIENSDCKACHTINKTSVGPSYEAIAKRYSTDQEAVARLAKKIVTGGGGAWGTEHVMSAHPQIATSDAEAIVQYILSIKSFAGTTDTLSAVGVLNFSGVGSTMFYALRASYIDSGTRLHGPVTTVKDITLRNATVPSYSMDRYVGFQRFRNELTPGSHKSYLLLKNVDLKNIRHFVFDYSSQDKGGEIEVRKDSFAGPVIATVKYGATGNWDNYKEIKAPLPTAETGNHDLYFIMLKRDKPDNDIIKIKSVSFQ